jgi:iron complex transport system ATP-binding protein
VLELRRVSFVRDGRTILAPLDWRVQAGERWLVLGANGSGKTTLLRIASMYEHPSTGDVEVLGERLGRTDVRVLRRRIGYLSAALAAQLRPALRCLDVVMTAKHAALEPWWHRYDEADEARALECLDRMGVAWASERALGTVSSGEQQRVLLARTLMNDPGVVLLDEPSARLDLGGREQLVQALAEITADPTAPPLVLVTHHLDEVPPGMTHVLMLRDGDVLTSGPLDACLTADTVSACFGMPLQLERRGDGRLSAWARATPAAARDHS